MKEEMIELRRLYDEVKKQEQSFVFAQGQFQDKWFDFLKKYCGAKEQQTMHMFELLEDFFKHAGGTTGGH